MFRKATIFENKFFPSLFWKSKIKIQNQIFQNFQSFCRNIICTFFETKKVIEKYIFQKIGFQFIWFIFFLIMYCMISLRLLESYWFHFYLIFLKTVVGKSSVLKIVWGLQPQMMSQNLFDRNRSLSGAAHCWIIKEMFCIIPFCAPTHFSPSISIFFEAEFTWNLKLWMILLGIQLRKWIC